MGRLTEALRFPVWARTWTSRPRPPALCWRAGSQTSAQLCHSQRVSVVQCKQATDPSMGRWRIDNTDQPLPLLVARCLAAIFVSPRPSRGTGRNGRLPKPVCCGVHHVMEGRLGEIYRSISRMTLIKVMFGWHRDFFFKKRRMYVWSTKRSLFVIPFHGWV